MPTYLTPGVYFEWADESRKGISPLRTDIAALIGLAERGPLHTPTRVRSWQQFQTVFGDFIAPAYLAYAVKSFFENGGRECFIVRVAAPPATTTTSGPQPAERASSQLLDVSGFAPGAIVTASQTRQQVVAGGASTSHADTPVADVSGFPQGALVEITQTQVGGTLRLWRRVAGLDAASLRIIWDQPLDTVLDLSRAFTLAVNHQSDHLLARVSGTQLFWESPLPTYYDLSRPISLATGAGSAAVSALGENGRVSLTISASSPGVWGNDLRVRIGRSSSAATRTRTAIQSADTSAVSSIAGFLDGALVRISQDDGSVPPAPVVSYRAVAPRGVDAARGRITWDAPLPAAYDLMAAQTGARPIAFETVTFSLSVYLNGQLREQFAGLTLLPDPGRSFPGRAFSAADERRTGRKNHAEQIVNSASRLIRIRDENWPHAPADYAGDLPDQRAPNMLNGRLILRGGRDGIAAVRPVDFIGAENEGTRSGLRTLETVDDVSMVAAPDVMLRPAPPVQVLRPTPPPVDECALDEPNPPAAEPPEPRWVERVHGFSLSEIERVQQAMVLHCEAMHDRIALLDTPPAERPIDDAGEAQSWRRRFESTFAALYYPWLMVLDPLRLRGDAVRRVPASGAVAGIFARSDLAYGVHKAPANEEVRWAQTATADINAAEQAVLNPMGINCIRTLAGRGLRLYGARTVSSDPAWRFVNVRRLMLMIEEAVESGVQWAVFEPNNLDLRHNLVVAISSFLETLWQKGALNGRVAEEAFFVTCDDTNNPPGLDDLGRLIVDVGVAPTRPAEFVVVRIGKTADTLELAEMGVYDLSGAVT
ncbi:MAG: phage tail sheath family protein [Chloroflexi bacterium]|nr:phage tail sheath family protein [Chloroflexota bacterium]